ncbi:MAG: invasion associated locus B family protein [Aurantimonas endophytica]|uniref:Invasion protein IalB n=1 Tax=Aurantimonas endophytica TaxID=1522175 RepID=A0A7W6HCD3_9HYPH|nr:invasion associated locus B family protein [Aurantimonas endophytica]MBB4002542.1 invasion protein IalB [Aurantimonas endophytica]MCO6403423.1 invasion associated locus B family protein [Aurantimonas endophytica]
MTTARSAIGSILALVLVSASGMPAMAQATAPSSPAQGSPSQSPQPSAPSEPAAPSAPATADAAPGPNWRVNCDGEGEARRCTVLQNLVADQGQGQQRLLTVMIQPGADAQPALLLALPHGLFLPAGVQLQIDGGEAEKLVIQTADQNGSYAGAALETDLIDRLKRGSALAVTFQSAQQQPVTVPVTLAGFSQAFEDYTAGRATETP